MRERRALEHVEVVDDGAAAEVKEGLAAAAVARPPALPPSDMRQGMLHRDPFPQLGSALRCELAVAEFVEEALIGMDVDTAAMRTGRAPLP